MKQQSNFDSLSNREAQAEIKRLRQQGNAIARLAQANMERADQQQQMLLQLWRRVEILEAYIRGEHEQN